MHGNRMARRLAPLVAILVTALACGPPAEASAMEPPSPVAMAPDALAPPSMVPDNFTCLEVIVPTAHDLVLVSFYAPNPTCAERGNGSVGWQADSPHRLCDFKGVADLTTGKLDQYRGACRSAPGVRSGGT